MIDSNAVVDPSVKLGKGVSVGPFAVIGADVELGDGTTVGPHAVIEGPTSIGKNNHIFQFSSVGEAPQDKKYAGEPTRLVIGDNNTIREFCTVNRGTVQGGGVTQIGNDNWIMAYCHIAHDCVVGNNTIFANCASIAGHVEVGDNAVLGGFTVVHQFCKIGAFSLTAMGTILLKDLPPFVRASGNTAEPHGINVEGLKRADFGADDVLALKRAYKLLYKSNLRVPEAIDQMETLVSQSDQIKLFTDFLKRADRGIIR